MGPNNLESWRSTQITRVGIAASTFILLAMSGFAGNVYAQDSTWNGGAGSWFDALMWDNGVPTGEVTIDNDAGTNSVVDTGNNATINIESLTVESGDQLNIGSNFDFGIVTNANPNSGQINNDGQITVTNNNSGSQSDLVIDGDVELSGTGTLTLAGGNNNSRILDQSGSDGHLTNSSTINGTGQVGANTLQLTNEAGGRIDADVNGRELVIDANASGMVNQGKLRALNGGQLTITDSNIDNTGGMVKALNNSKVQLRSGTSISGGSIESTGSGVVEIADNNTVTIADATIVGTLNQGTNTDLFLDGNINNTSTDFNVTNNNSGFLSDLVIDQSTSIGGGGSITLGGGNLNSRILDQSTATLGTLTNDNHTIQGKGQLGVNTLKINNGSTGLIDANDSMGATLTIDPLNNEDLTNTGTLRASNGGELVLSGSGGGKFLNNGGRIEAQSGSTVRLANIAVVEDGDLESFGTGKFVVGPNDNGELKDVTFAGQLEVGSNTDLELKGTITNSGVFTLTNANNGFATDLQIEEAVTLSGGGTITLGGGNNNSRILDEVGAADGVLTIVDNTIQGHGQIGTNRMGLVNETGGTINANVAGMSLNVDVAGPTFTNDGNLIAESSAILNIADALESFGTLRADAGGLIDVDDTLLNQDGGSLIGNGEIEADFVTNDGRIAPGASVGHLTIDSDALFTTNSLLDIEVDGSGADLLTVTGGLTVDGDLQLSLLSGFLPSISDTYVVANSNSDILGTFDNVTNGQDLLTIGGEGTFTVHYGVGSAFGSDQVVLSNFVANVPEPGSVALLALLTSSLFVRRRRS